MDLYDWKIEIKEWIEKRRTIKKFENDLTEFFQNAFCNTQIPDKAYFGSTNSSISLLVGGIYLAAYVCYGNDKGIWLLLDKKLSPLEGVVYETVKSTEASKNKLIWLHSNNLQNLSLINHNPNVWFSYGFASYKVIKTPKGYSTRQNFIKNKKLLNSFWKKNLQIKIIHTAPFARDYVGKKTWGDQILC